MSAILEQLELNKTFFAQFITFTILFILLSRIYFKPFLKLIENRHARTVQDKEAAEKLQAQAASKLEEYKRQLATERAEARKEYEAVLDEAKKQEAIILGSAREEAKKITQATVEQMTRERQAAGKKLEGEVDHLARVLADRMLGQGGQRGGE